MRALRTAVGLLTVLPVGRAAGPEAGARPGGDAPPEAEAPPEAGAAPESGAGRSTAWFPAVGLLVGLAPFLVLLLPLPGLAGAALALAAWTVATGALHEDAWIDCMDAAFAPGRGREARLAILRDPHVGAHGVTGGVLLLLVRFAGLAAVPAAAVLAAPVVGRWCMAVSLAAAPPARPDGLGALFARDARPLAATLVAVPALLPAAVLLDPGRTALAWAAGAAAGLAAGWFFARRFGGLTGDGHGAVGILAETVALLAFLSVGHT